MTKPKSTDTKIKSSAEYLKEKVPCVIRKPENTDEAFTTVTVNGTNYQIQFNRQVLVPRFVKEVIENSYKADDEARLRIEELLFAGEKI